MAFFRKVGNMLRQSASKIMGAKLQPWVPKDSIFQNIRCSTIPSSKLFIRGISCTTCEQQLTEAFSKYGRVMDTRVIVDKVTGWSRGFCITYPSIREASHAIKAMNGQTLRGRKIKVSYVKVRFRGIDRFREGLEIDCEDALDIIENLDSSDGSTFSGDVGSGCGGGGGCGGRCGGGS
ncbi:hypothetical protein SLA2020_200040 [Shorea laevis]